MFRIAFFEPRIAGNTGSAIRLAAVSGSELHLIEPLGFDLEEPKLRRAGLDYHDLAVMTVHADIEAAYDALLPARVFAFTGKGDTLYTDVAYEPGDVLLFGPEPTGSAGRRARTTLGSQPAYGCRCWPGAVDEPRQLRLDRGLRGVASARVRHPSATRMTFRLRSANREHRRRDPILG